MEKIRCLIAEDEPLAQDRLKILLEKYEEHSLTVSACCANGLEVIRTLKEQTVEIIFLDLQMPAMDGDALLEVLDKFTEDMDTRPLIIIVSSFERTVSQIQDTNYGEYVVDYLVKPFDDSRFQRAVKRAIRRLPSRPLVIKHKEDKSDTLLESAIDPDQIICINSNGPKIFIKYRKDKSVSDYSKSNIGNLSVIGTTLAELETELPPQSFFRIHNSYLVNRNSIVSKSKDEVQLQGNDRLPLARNRREDFHRWYMKNPMKS